MSNHIVVAFTAAQVNALKAVESEDGSSITADEIGNIVHNRFGDGDAAEAAVSELVARGLLSNKLDINRFVLSPIGRWVLGELNGARS